jgi:hypothetical protein
MTGTVSTEELEQRLFSLQPDQFLELYRLYEKLGSKADVQPEMEILRRRLVRMRPVRALTLTRLLCQPFEEFLVNQETADAGLILRRHCTPISRLVRRRLPADQLARFEQRLAHLNQRPEDRAGQFLLGREVWKAAAVALNGVRCGPARRPVDLRRRLGLVIGCLEIGDAMVSLARGIPEGRVDTLDDSGRKLLVKLLRGLPHDRTGHARYLMALLSRRLENPASVITMLAGDDRSLPGATRQNLIRVVRSEIEKGIDADTTELASGDLSTRESVQRAERLLDRLGGIKASGAAGAMTQKAGQRIADTLDGIGKLISVEELQQERQKQIAQLLPPELSAGLEHAETYRELESQIDNVIRLGDRIDRLGIDNPLRRRRDELRRDIDARRAEMMRQLPRTGADPAAQASARAGLYGLVRMVEMLEGPKAAENLRREGDLLLVGSGG